MLRKRGSEPFKCLVKETGNWPNTQEKLQETTQIEHFDGSLPFYLVFSGSLPLLLRIPMVPASFAEQLDGSLPRFALVQFPAA